MNDKQGCCTLDGLPVGARFQVKGVCLGAHVPPEWSGWLEELGFLAGEQGKIMARAALGGDPLVVRIGLSTFALRCAEAACVQVQVQAHVHTQVQEQQR